MCFFYALSKTAQTLTNRYQLKDELDLELSPELKEPIYYVSGFDFPRMPVLTNEQPYRIQSFNWGLIPAWVKSAAAAGEIRSKTLNARSETVFMKPAFREAIRRRRCLVPADGFYEWREWGGKKYPYYIFLKDKSIFSFAGIWEEWADRATGEVLKTFSILTTEANFLLEKIHNTKKRMPVIIPRNNERNWLSKELSNDAVSSLTKPYDPDLMEAYPIGRLISSPKGKRNLPIIQEAFEYPELKG